MISERNFAAAIGTIHAVRRARLELPHVPRRWSIRADTYLTVRAETPVEAAAPVAGGIPGFDRTGQEVIAGTFRVNDAPLSWDLHGRCGFATDLPTAPTTDAARTKRSGCATVSRAGLLADRPSGHLKLLLAERVFSQAGLAGQRWRY